MFQLQKILFRVPQLRNFTRSASNYIIKRATVDRHTHSSNIAAVVSEFGEITSKNDWEKLKNTLFDTTRYITEKNFDALILQYCTSYNNFELAEKFCEYLKEKSNVLSLGVIGKYFRLYYFMVESGYKTKITEEEILSLYSNFRKKYGVIDSVTGENAICALSISKSWKECFQVLNEIKLTQVPSTEAYSCTANAAFANNDFKAAFSILEEAFLNNRTIRDKTYFKCLESIDCNNASNAEEKLQKLQQLLYFFEAHDVLANNDFMNKLIEFAHSIDLTAKFAAVSPKGDCSICKRRLQRLTLTNREFDSLKTAFYEKVIVGNNVFTKTNPEELERFKKFLNNGAKYDVVIDGLNVAYRVGKGAPNIASNTIYSVINHFSREGKNVLLMGRSHMKKWPRFINNIEKSASYFLTENLSYDDPFLLYSALNSGPKTIIVTNDQMRSHLFLLKDIKLKRLFAKWFLNCQYSVNRLERSGKPVFMYPSPYLKTTQKEDRYWHIPSASVHDSDNYNKEWVCLKV